MSRTTDRIAVRIAAARKSIAEWPHQFTREARLAVAGAVVVGVAAGALVLLAPVYGVYRAEFKAEATVIEARAAAEADWIRARGFYRADTSVAHGARLLLELKAIEGGR